MEQITRIFFLNKTLSSLSHYALHVMKLRGEEQIDVLIGNEHFISTFEVIESFSICITTFIVTTFITLLGVCRQHLRPPLQLRPRRHQGRGAQAAAHLCIGLTKYSQNHLLKP
ncbi:MAG: hypothetical protein QWI73_06580 [Alphaproteobacteria bacterium]|nr:hypothetical protein [Alphaproteobacteria bacterium]